MARKSDSAKRRKHSRAKPLGWLRPRLEQLEDRRVMAVSTSLVAGVLTFTGDFGGVSNDKVIIQSTSPAGFLEYDDGSGLGSQTSATAVTQVIFNGNGGTDELVFIQANPNIFAPAGGVQFDGGSGSDTLTMVGGSAATFTSGAYNFTGPDSGTISYSTTGGTVNVAVTGMELINDTTTSGPHTTTGTGAGDGITLETGPVLPPVVGFQQGPVIVDGGDRDDHGFFSGGVNFNGWKFIEQMVNFVHTQSFIPGASGILSIGTDPSTQASAAIDSAAAVLGLSVTHVNGSANILAQSFTPFKLLYIPSNIENTTGGISGTEIDALFARRADIQTYVRAGGGIVALTEEDSAAATGEFSWLQIPDPFTIIGFTTGGISDPLRKTPQAIAAGFTISDAELSNGVPYHNVFTGPPGFNGLDIFVKDDGPNNIVGDSDDRNVTLGQGAINQLFGGGATIKIYGSFPTLQVGMKPSLGVNGAGGNDTITVDGATNFSLDGIGVPLSIDGGPAVGGDRLIITDTLDATGDTININQTSIEGLTGYAGTPDIAYANIDSLSVTGTGGSDTIDTQLNAGSDLDAVTVSGANGNDQFYVDLNTGNMTTNDVAGLVSLALNGNAGIDTFGETPSNAPLPPPPAPLQAPVFPLGKGKIQPSTTTVITINGGSPTVGGPPAFNATAGNVAGDKLNLDMSPASGPSVVVIVSTVSGLATATGYQNTNFSDIESIELCDQFLLTHVQMGDLFIRGTEGADVIQFQRTSTPNIYRTRVNSQFFNLGATRKMVVYGRGGNDMLMMVNTPLDAEFYGEGGDDYMSGYTGNDLMVGGDGKDRIIGHEGNNEMWGDNLPMPANGFALEGPGDGADQISGGSGLDTIYGQGGNDVIDAVGGVDYVSGGSGDDNIAGGEGNDRLYGGAGNDTVSGDAGDDLVAGNAGNDRLYGRGGNDAVIGGLGADLMTGDDGNDLMFDGTVMLLGGTDASLTKNDASDVAMLLLLTNWQLGIITPGVIHPHDGDVDSISGGAGTDSASPGPEDFGDWDFLF